MCSFFPSEHMWVATFVSVVVAAVTLLIIYRYLASPYVPLGEPVDAARVQALVDRFGGNASHIWRFYLTVSCGFTKSMAKTA